MRRFLCVPLLSLAILLLPTAALASAPKKCKAGFMLNSSVRVTKLGKFSELSCRRIRRELRSWDRNPHGQGWKISGPQYGYSQSIFRGHTFIAFSLSAPRY